MNDEWLNRSPFNCQGIRMNNPDKLPVTDKRLWENTLVEALTYERGPLNPGGVRPGDFLMTSQIPEEALDAVLDRFVANGCEDTREDIAPERYLFIGWDEVSNELEVFDDPLHFSGDPRLLTYTEVLASDDIG